MRGRWKTHQGSKQKLSLLIVPAILESRLFYFRSVTGRLQRGENLVNRANSRELNSRPKLGMRGEQSQSSPTLGGKLALGRVLCRFGVWSCRGRLPRRTEQDHRLRSKPSGRQA